MSANSVILAGASVRSLAESALRSQWNPACIDQFGDADLPERAAIGDAGLKNCRMTSFDELPDILAQYDRSIPLIWSGGLENYPETVRRIAGTRLIAGPDARCLRRVRDPFELHRVLTAGGCLMPDVRHCGEFRPGDVPGVWLLKPLRGAGGIGIRRIERPDDLAVLASGEQSSGLYLQKYIDGVPVSTLYQARDGDVRIVGSCLQLIGEQECGAGGFQFCGNYGPISLPEHVQSQLKRSGREVGRSFNLQGCFGIDFVLRNGRAYVLEVNPRITASHEIFELTSRSGWNAVESQLRAFGVQANCTHSNPAPQQAVDADLPTVILRMILYTTRETTITDVLSQQLLSATQRHSATIAADGAGDGSWAVRLADIPQESVIAAGTPLCSVYAHKLPKRPMHVPNLPTFADTERLIRQVSGLVNFRVARQICRFERLSEILQSGNNLTPQRTSLLPWNLSYESP